MGWCNGGTEIFDEMVGIFLGYNLSDIGKRQAILELAKVLEDQDWDCQSESCYYNDPIVQSVFKELHPDWFEDEDKDYRKLLTTLRTKFSEIEKEITNSFIIKGDLDNLKMLTNEAREMISDILGNL